MPESNKNSDRGGNSETDGWLELEAKNFERANNLTRSKLDKESQLTVWNKWVAEDLAQDDWVVQTQDVESYYLPTTAKAFVGADLVAEWDSIVGDICEVHNQVVGMRVGRAGIALAGDKRVRDSHMRLRVWADVYVQRRVEKTSYKQGGTLRQFQNIYSELLPQLESIAYQEGTANSWFFGEFTDYLPTALFLKTCRTFVEFRFDVPKMLPSYRIHSTDPVSRSGLGQMVQLYQWSHIASLPNVLRVAAEAGTFEFDSLSAEDMHNWLELLVDDIQEMRPFLRHNYKAENVVFELSPGLVVGFQWAVGRGVGLVLVAPSVTQMLMYHRVGTSGLTLMLTYDGLLANFATPWIDTVTVVEHPLQALMANLRIVEAIHEKLFAMYEKIDRDAVLNRFRKRLNEASEAEVEVEPTDDEFAALCQLIADPVENSVLSDRSQFMGVRAVRLQRLLEVLSDKLACEVRLGKGSEIVIFRSGGHHFRLGHQ